MRRLLRLPRPSAYLECGFLQNCLDSYSLPRFPAFVLPRRKAPDLALTYSRIVLRLPFEFIHERYLTHPSQQLPFTQGASFFEDFVIRCVRYAFSNIPAGVGRVFFSKHVSLPFLRWRMLRHGYLRSPIYWDEYMIPGVRDTTYIAGRSRIIASLTGR